MVAVEIVPESEAVARVVEEVQTVSRRAWGWRDSTMRAPVVGL